MGVRGNSKTKKLSQSASKDQGVQTPAVAVKKEPVRGNSKTKKLSQSASKADPKKRPDRKIKKRVNARRKAAPKKRPDRKITKRVIARRKKSNRTNGDQCANEKCRNNRTKFDFFGKKSKCHCLACGQIYHKCCTEKRTVAHVENGANPLFVEGIFTFKKDKYYRVGAKLRICRECFD